MRHNCKTNPKRQVVSAEKDFILINEEIMRRSPRLDEVNKIHNVSDVDRQNAERKLTNLSQTSYVFIFLVFKLSCCLSP